MKALRYLILSAAALALTAVDAGAQTWICDSKAATGFDRERGYEIINFSESRSYRIRIGIDNEELTTEWQREHNVFESDRNNYQPASIQRISEPFVELCMYHKHQNPFSEAKSFFESVSCESVAYGKFQFDLQTGLFSVVENGFERLTDGQTWAEVGECKRIN